MAKFFAGNELLPFVTLPKQKSTNAKESKYRSRCAGNAIRTTRQVHQKLPGSKQLNLFSKI